MQVSWQPHARTATTATLVRPPERAVRRLVLDPGRVQRALLSAVAVLVALSTAGQLALHLLPAFPGRDFLAYAVYLDNEQSVPTAFAFLLLLACAGASGVIAWRVRREGLEGARHWTAVSALFVVVALDELMAVHERAIEPLREQLGTGGLLNFAWVIPGMAVAVLLAAVFARFLLRLPASTRRLTILAAALFLGGALGFEMLGGAYADRQGTDGLGYAAISTTEETLELVGATVFIYAALRHLRDHLDPFEVSIRTGP